ncbi:MAG: ferritin family protein [Candidatus Omnitrophica bacterium]|nr:ferritin family protein [Candidatus Omnitrophota bacterium]
MGNIFSGSEIVEIGIQIEKNGGDFYNTLVLQTKNPEAQKIFEFLAGEEEKHIKVFQGILDSLEKYEPAESYPGEYLAYMNALAREYVFTQKDKGKQIAQKTSGDKEATDLGIGFEKDSIVFYEGMKKCVPDFDLKVLDSLINQEQQHLRILVELKNSLTKGK